MRACNHTYQRRSVALVWVAVVGMVLIGFLGLAMDMSLTVLTGYQLQNAVDAASLAGAMKVRNDQNQVRDLAQATALANTAAHDPVLLDRNDANTAEGDIVIGSFDRITQTFTPDGSPTNAVKVVGRRTSDSQGGPLSLIFGPVFGVDTTEVTRDAIAMIGGDTGSGLIALDPHAECALRIDGNVTLSVNDISDPDNPYPGLIQVNSDWDNPRSGAACVNGLPDINAGEINVNGTADRSLENLPFDGELNAECNCTIPDPLAYLPPIPMPFGPDHGTISVTAQDAGTVSLSPGYYSGGISMTNDAGYIYCAPGVYVVDGAGLDIKGGSLYADGVMFYVVDTTPTDNKESHVYLGGNGTIHLSGIDCETYGSQYPAGTDIYEGISIFQARPTDYDGACGNTNDATIIGTGTMDLTGTYYFPAALLKLSGTCDSVGNQLIANQLLISGNGVLGISYDGRNPAPGNKVFLVE